MGASLRDRDTRPTDQAAARLGDTASVPSAGPWQAIHYGYEKYGIYDERQTDIAFVHRRRDAELIAAAPELLEALSELLRAYGPSLPMDACPRCLKAKAALAKAEGNGPPPLSQGGK